MSDPVESELPEVVSCNGCGRELQMWERFCPHCGVDQFARVYAGNGTGVPAVAAEQLAVREGTPHLREMTRPARALDSDNAPGHGEYVAGEERLQTVTQANGVAGVAHRDDVQSLHLSDATMTAQVTRQWPNIFLGVLIGLVLAISTYICVERQYFQRGDGKGLQSLKADIAILRAALTGSSTTEPVPAADVGSAAKVARPELSIPDRNAPADRTTRPSGASDRP